MDVFCVLVPLISLHVYVIDKLFNIIWEFLKQILDIENDDINSVDHNDLN